MKLILLYMALFVSVFPSILHADTIVTTQPISKTMMSNSNTMIVKKSPYSVAKTMDKFETIVKNKGLSVFARIDHLQNAASVDMTMDAAQVLIFGNPKAGTLLMQKDIRVALDLPMRVVVYQTKDGVYLAYHNPQTFSNNYDLAGVPVLNKLETALDKLSDAALK